MLSKEGLLKYLTRYTNESWFDGTGGYNIH